MVLSCRLTLFILFSLLLAWGMSSCNSNTAIDSCKSILPLDSIDYELALKDTALATLVVLHSGDTQHIRVREIKFINETSHIVWLPVMEIPKYTFDILNHDSTINSNLLAGWEKESFFHGGQGYKSGWLISVCGFDFTGNWTRVEPHSNSKLFFLPFNADDKKQLTDSTLFQISYALDSTQGKTGIIQKHFATSGKSVKQFTRISKY